MTDGTPRLKARDLNNVIRYTMWSVFRLRDGLPAERDAVAEEVQELLDQSPARTW